MRNNNMADVRNFDAGVTLVLIIGLEELAQLFLGNVCLECKTSRWRSCICDVLSVSRSFEGTDANNSSYTVRR